MSANPTAVGLRLPAQLGLLVVGSFLIAGAVAVTIWTGLGPGPLDVFIGAIHNITGLPLAVAVWATVASLIVVAAAFGRRPGFGTVLSPLMIGPMLQSTSEVLDRVEPPTSIGALIVVQLVAIATIGVGAGALVVSGLGAGSGELFTDAASSRLGRSATQIRPVVELSWVVTGMALGGPAGTGTVMVALLIGPAVLSGHRLIDVTVRRFVGRHADEAARADDVLVAV